MRIDIVLRMALLGLLVLVFAFHSTGYGDETEKDNFVDLDGDGINDNESDNDGNRIPDKFEGKDIEFETGEVRSILGNVFNSDKSMKADVDLRTNTDRFGSLAFKARGLPQRCQCFGTEDEFGSESGPGVASGTSGCVGGVCTR